jgi:carbonic anhydrase
MDDAPATHDALPAPGGPAGPFADLLDANRRHRESFSLGGLSSHAARGLAIVTCVDTRIDPLAVLGLEPGDAKIVRNAGARVTADVLRSLALTTALLGVTRIAVIQHTDCALTKMGDEQLRVQVAQATGADTTGWQPLAIGAQEPTLRADVDRVRQDPLIGRGVVVAGFVYDVGTGDLRPVC